jgi:hypothetical protein
MNNQESGERLNEENKNEMTTNLVSENGGFSP